NQLGGVGLWGRAAGHYRRAFEVQPPTDFAKWFDYAVLLLETGDAAGYGSLVERAAARVAADTGTDLFHLGRALLLAPDSGTRHPAAVGRVAGSTVGQPWARGPCGGRPTRRFAARRRRTPPTTGCTAAGFSRPSASRRRPTPSSPPRSPCARTTPTCGSPAPRSSPGSGRRTGPPPTPSRPSAA